MLGRGLEVLPGDSGPKNSAGWPAGFGPPGCHIGRSGGRVRQWRTMRNCLGAPNRYEIDGRRSGGVVVSLGVCDGCRRQEKSLDPVA
jgi:hypothetical protein